MQTSEIYIFFFGEATQRSISVRLPAIKPARLEKNSHSLSLRLGRIKINSFQQDRDYLAEVSIQARSYVQPEQLCLISILPVVECHAEVSIISSEPPTPLNCMACPIGVGVLAVQWTTEANAEEILFHELYVSDSLNGDYQQWPGGRVTETRATLYNLPLNTPIYLRVRSVSVNGSVSNWGQVKLGKLVTISQQMKVTSISGSRLLNGATFTNIDRHGNQIVTATADGAYLVQ